MSNSLEVSKAEPTFSYVPAILRDPTRDDVNFIINSWLKSYRSSNFADPITSDVYFKHHRSMLVGMIERGVTVISCNPEDEAQIFGWANGSPSEYGIAILNYIYVKHPYRRLGFGTMLHREMLSKCGHDHDLPSMATHSTRMLRDVLSDKWNIVYNPYLIGAAADGSEEIAFYKIR